MTYRPGRVAEIVQVGLEFPRELSMSTRPDFQDYVALIRSKIARSQLRGR